MRKGIIAVLVIVILLSLAGCSTTNYKSQRFVVNDNGEGVLTDEVKIGHTKLLVIDNKIGLTADLFDGSAIGVEKIETDPDQAAITPVTNAIIEAIKGKP